MSKAEGSILLTGANRGLGKAFIGQLLASEYASKYHGIYTVRNISTAQNLRDSLPASTSHTFETPVLDLSSLENVREIAEDINTRVANGSLPPIRSLVLNAAWQGDYTLKPSTFTKDGFESSFGINYLANFLLVLLLLQSIDKEHGRIVYVSSWAHDPFHPSNQASVQPKQPFPQINEFYENTNELVKGKVYEDHPWQSAMRRYGTSKLCTLMFMYQLQSRLNQDIPSSRISVVSMDPAAMAGTGIARNAPLWVRILLGPLGSFLGGIACWFNPNGMIRTPWKSGGDILNCCFGIEEKPKGVYMNGSEKSDSSAESHDKGKQQQLWRDSVKLANVREGDTVLKDWQ